MVRKLYIALSACLLAACASSLPPFVEKMDPLTSTTLTYGSTPMVLYRDDPARAAHARNFVSLGPLQANRSGHYQYFLWLGIWNTNQSLSAAERRDGFDAIILLVDGEPMALEIAGWTPDVIGASEPVYRQPVASALDAYYEVTADQIRLMAQASDIQIRTTGFPPREFEPWGDQETARTSLQHFVRRIY